MLIYKNRECYRIMCKKESDETVTNNAECVRNIRTDHGRRCEEKPTFRIATPNLVEVFCVILQYNFSETNWKKREKKKIGFNTEQRKKRANLEIANGSVVNESGSVIIIFVSGDSRAYCVVMILITIRSPISDNIRFRRQWRNPRNYNAPAITISLCYMDLQNHRNNKKEEPNRKMIVAENLEDLGETCSGAL